MASIERTAYPRFKPSLTATKLHALPCPTDDERAFITTHTRGETQSIATFDTPICFTARRRLEQPRTAKCRCMPSPTVPMHTRRLNTV